MNFAIAIIWYERELTFLKICEGVTAMLYTRIVIVVHEVHQCEVLQFIPSIHSHVFLSWPSHTYYTYLRYSSPFSSGKSFFICVSSCVCKTKGHACVNVTQTRIDVLSNYYPYIVLPTLILVHTCPPTGTYLPT
jgi:hypothetical protein